MPKPYNECAFPSNDPRYQSGVFGMTLRDYFAGYALTCLDVKPDSFSTLEQSAQRAYAVADAMLAERANDATTTTYIIQCPICHTKSEWAEPGAMVAVQTTAEIAAENAQCNAAYLAKKTAGP